MSIYELTVPINFSSIRYQLGGYLSGSKVPHSSQDCFSTCSTLVKRVESGGKQSLEKECAVHILQHRAIVVPESRVDTTDSRSRVVKDDDCQGNQVGCTWLCMKLKCSMLYPSGLKARRWEVSTSALGENSP